MSTIDAYAGSFVGNDFVAQQMPKKIRTQRAKIRYEDSPEHITYPEPATYSEPIALPVYESITQPEMTPVVTQQEFTVDNAYEPRRNFMPTVDLSLLSNHKKQLIIVAVALLSSITLLGACFTAKATIIRSTHASVSFVERSLSSVHQQSTANYTLPAHSILIHTSDLSNDLSDIEAQSITVNLGNSVITPLPTAIQQWVSVSSAPQSAAKVLTIKTGNIETYLRSSIAADTTLPSLQAKDTALASVNQAAKQIAKILFSCKGIILNISTSTTNP
jgi:hypothetical protein